MGLKTCMRRHLIGKTQRVAHATSTERNGNIHARKALPLSNFLRDAQNTQFVFGLLYRAAASRFGMQQMHRTTLETYFHRHQHCCNQTSPALTLGNNGRLLSHYKHTVTLFEAPQTFCKCIDTCLDFHVMAVTTYFAPAKNKEPQCFHP
jgi:hypothetical protein